MENNNERITCLLCNNQNVVLLHDQSQSKYFPRKIRKCQDCGYAFVFPQPTPEQLNTLYEQMDYFDAMVSKDINKLVNPGQVKRARDRLQWLTKNGLNGNGLDIGCAHGEFIMQANKLGLITSGMDLSSRVAERARSITGATIYTDDLKNLAAKGLYFDFVTLWDVIEHVLSPKELLLDCKACMHSDSLLAISTPNQRNYHGIIHGNNWKGYFDGPEHLHFFNSKTLSKLLEQQGFTVVSVRTRKIAPFLLRWATTLGFGNELEVLARMQ